MDPGRGRTTIDLQPARGGGPAWRIALGALVIGYGAVLLLENLGVAHVYRIERAYIPFAVFVLGVVGLLNACSSLGRTIGAVAVIGGGAWTYASLMGIRVDVGFWWPLVLMALGVIFLFRAREPVTSPGSGVPAGPSQASAVAFWSGVRRRITSAAFSRADFMAVMGGIEADLRPATTAGGVAVIEVFVLMGGIEITVPPDWAVVNRAAVIMGGVTDRSTGTQGAANTLEIHGVVIMGGVEIKT
jgi:hypothetical protein